MPLILSGCGAGGGNVESASAPVIPVNKTITNLQASESFANDAANTAVVFDLATGTGVSGTVSRGALTISYNATTRGYTLNYAGQAQNFGTADMYSDSRYLSVYQKSDSNGRSILNLLKNYNDRSQPTQYVGMGFWQYITRENGRQNTDFISFAYGLPTGASAIPRTGKASFSTDLFGIVSGPGTEPRSFDGLGDFTADFGSGLFSAHSYLTVTGLVSGESTSGGGLELSAKGYLSASNGTFSGTSLYGGERGGAPGVLNGRFYGPGAAELGASFSGTAADGTTYAGSMVGLRDASIEPLNLTLLGMTSSQYFYTHQLYNSIGGLNWQNSDTFTYSPPSSDLYGGQFTINDKVVSADPNFTSYRKTFSSSYDSQDVKLELYRPGSGNSELALTYASFGHWSSSVPVGAGRLPVDQYFAYGIQETAATQIAAKRGMGRYDGVVYGAGSTGMGGTRYAVKGTSVFNVDFSANSYSGALAMAGTPTAGGAAVDFGAFDFAGTLSAYLPTTSVGLMRAGTAVGQLETRFYGPDGEELAGPFSLNVPTGSVGAGTNIVGVTVAKRQ